MFFEVQVIAGEYKHIQSREKKNKFRKKISIQNNPTLDVRQREPQKHVPKVPCQPN
jgi:hypothetical protein